MWGEYGLEKFRSNLKELRLAAGLTLDELADETGIGTYKGKKFWVQGFCDPEKTI